MVKYDDRISNKEYTIVLFNEINQHLINTENKYMQIFIAHLGLLTFIMGMFVNKGIGEIFKPNDENLILYLFIIFIGCILFVLQIWYRRWKVYYQKLSSKIAYNWPIDDKIKPSWLKDKKEFCKLSFDCIPHYLTTIINIIMVAIWSCKYYVLHQNLFFCFVDIVFIAFTLYFYLLFYKGNSNSSN